MRHTPVTVTRSFRYGAAGQRMLLREVFSGQTNHVPRTGIDEAARRAPNGMAVPNGRCWYHLSSVDSTLEGSQADLSASHANGTISIQESTRCLRSHVAKVVVSLISEG